jgi:hypothetical protein
MFPERQSDRRGGLGVAFLLGRLILPAAFLALALVPVAFLDRLPAVCLYQRLFGVRCLGCGMTHAFCAVLHGHLAAAFRYNRLVVSAFPFFAVVAARHLGTAAAVCRDRRLPNTP